LGLIDVCVCTSVIFVVLSYFIFMFYMQENISSKDNYVLINRPS